MPLARHDTVVPLLQVYAEVSTHMPLARHDLRLLRKFRKGQLFLLTCLLRGMTFFSSSLTCVM